MRRKTVSGIMLTMLLTSMLTLTFNIQPVKADPRTIIVPDHYPTIQSAVDNANPGDTIYVRAGKYRERVYIGSSTSGRSQLKIVGENPSNTTVDSAWTGSAPGPFNIWQSDHITITGFTVTTVGYGAGIDLHRSQYCNITGNRILESDWNIGLQNDCHHNLISNNILIDGLEGILLFSSWGAFPCTSNTIMNNNITCISGGIIIEYCDDNAVIGNTLSSTASGYRGDGGIEISHSNRCFFRNNDIAGDFPFCVYGDSVLDYIHDIDTSNRVDGKPIYYWINEHDKTIPYDAGVVYVVNSTSIRILDLNLKGQTSAVNLISTSGSIIHNTTARAGRIGISLLDSSDNIVDDNTLYSNMGVGLQLGSLGLSSQNNTILRNKITDNRYGILLSACSNNKFYHNNFIRNTQQVYVWQSYVNAWDDGYPSGGNYWSDYTGVDLYNGPYQNITGSDGIGDAPYVIDGNNRDNYPLMKPYPWATHDIGITIVTTSKTIVGKGYNVSITIMTFNYGNFTENFNVTAYANTTTIETKEVTLTSRNSTTITFTWNTTGFDMGDYTISAVADIVTNETDTLDNTYIDGTVTVRLPIHNIAVTDVTPSKTVVGQDYSLNINVAVANQGDYTETFNVTVYANTTIIETKTSITLTSGNSTTLSFIWNTSGFVKGNYTIWAYAEPVPGETDTTDNTFTDGWVMVAMVGDIASIDSHTGKVVDIPDGKVDIVDIAKIAKLFGVTYPDLRYEPDCDITGPIIGVPDGKIDIRDVATIAVRFGQVDP